MGTDIYQQAWQSQSSRTRVAVDADLLLQEVERNQGHFKATIFWRDVREVGSALVMIPVWIVMGVMIHLPWMWYLGVLGFLWVAGFILLDRMRHRPKPGAPSEPLLASVAESRRQVEHQIWLLRNVFWWYLLPCMIPMLLFFAQVAWRSSRDTWGFFVSFAMPSLFVAAIYYWIYRVNQRAVRVVLRPRRQELLTLLANLGDEPIGDDALAGELADADSGLSLRRWLVIAGLCILSLAVWALARLYFKTGEDRPAVPIEDVELFRARIDEFLAAAHETAGFSGAVLVARGGKPVYEGAFGVSHLDSQAANTLDTPFRIASLSKQFTAAAIFRLAAQAKLKIDDPVHLYLKEFAQDPYRDITIHQLLTHSSGLPRSPDGALGRMRWYALSREPTPVDDYVRLAVDTPLEFEPGTAYQYSNIGYRVLSALIARVTGREYADFMEEEVFQPLEMSETGVARVDRPASEQRIAEGLTTWRIPLVGRPRYSHGENGRNYGTGYGSGGIYSSARDLLRWDRVLAGDEFLSAEQKARLFEPVHDNYACGWIVKKSGLDGRLYQMHNGANEGFFSQMMRIPEDDLVIIAAGNVTESTEIDDILDQLFRLCRSLPYHQP